MEKIYGKLHRGFIQLAHRYGWHHVKVIFPDRDIQLWCQWCGLRQSYDGEHHYFDKKTGLVKIRMDVLEKEITKAISTPKGVNT